MIVLLYESELPCSSFHTRILTSCQYTLLVLLVMMMQSSIMEKEPSIPSSEESLVSTSMTKKHSVWHEYNSKIKPIGTKNGSLLLITADHSPEVKKSEKKMMWLGVCGRTLESIVERIVHDPAFVVLPCSHHT